MKDETPRLGAKKDKMTKEEIFKEDYILKLYEEACWEQNSFIRKLRIAFCLVLLEDRKLLEELAKL